MVGLSQISSENVYMIWILKIARFKLQLVNNLHDIPLKHIEIVTEGSKTSVVQF